MKLIEGDTWLGRHKEIPASIGYNPKHRRVEAVRGKAKEHMCVMCGERQARYWATVHGANRTDVWMDFVPLCARCHNRYDRISERATAAAAATPATPELRAKRRAAANDRWRTPEFREKMSRGIANAVWTTVSCPICGMTMKPCNLSRHTRARHRETAPPD